MQGSYTKSTMVSLLKQNRQEIVDLCQRYSVKRFAVFGSASRGSDFLETSDLDFLVEFYPLHPVEHKNAYFGLLFALEDLLKRPVDLVVEGVVTNSYVKTSMNSSQETLYAAA